MPFTFKLSQRLARMRCALFVLSTAALAACEKPSLSVTAPPVLGVRIIKVIVSPDTVAISPSQTTQFTAFGRTEAGVPRDGHRQQRTGQRDGSRDGDERQHAAAAPPASAAAPPASAATPAPA